MRRTGQGAAHTVYRHHADRFAVVQPRAVGTDDRTAVVQFQRPERFAARLRGGVRRSATCWIAAGTSR